MNRLLALAFTCFVSASFASGEHSHHHTSHSAGSNPYADMLGRDIKALSPQQVSDLRSGKGMGLSLPAELNGAPGPMHALQLADSIALTSEQKAKLHGIVDKMRTDAIELGKRIIDAERRLDTDFKGRKLSAEAIDAQSLSIAELNGQLRAVHLKAHLQTAQILTASQIDGYNRARGYAASSQGARK